MTTIAQALGYRYERATADRLPGEQRVLFLLTVLQNTENLDEAGIRARDALAHYVHEEEHGPEWEYLLTLDANEIVQRLRHVARYITTPGVTQETFLRRLLRDDSQGKIAYRSSYA